MLLPKVIRQMRTIPLLVQGFIFIAASAAAQPIKSYYQLKNVQLELSNGRVMRSELLGFSEDSIVVEDREKIPPGSLISVRLPHTGMATRCQLKDLSETHLILSNEDDTVEWRIARTQLTDLHVVKYSLDGIDLVKYQMTSIPYSQVESLALHRKGSGLAMGLVGFLVGGVIGSALHKDPPPPQQNTFSTAFTHSIEVAGERGAASFMGSMIGMSFGILIGTTNKKHYIHGNQEAFLQLRKKVVRTR